MTIFHIVHMVVIDTQCSLESFRRFIIESTCSSYIPESYASDYEIFAEKYSPLCKFVEISSTVPSGKCT